MSAPPGGPPPVRSLGARSDMAVMEGVSTFEDLGDRIVQRTPSEPAFWFGNMTWFRGDEVDAAAQVPLAEAAFPGAAHCCIGWDAPAMRADPRHDPFRAAGFEVEETDVLTLLGPVPEVPAPEGMAVRPLGTDGEFEAALAQDLAEGVADGLEPRAHEAFLRRRFAARRRQVALGRAAWFGAFAGDALAGSLGIVLGEGVARYQDVGTAPRWRRRGVASALVAAAAGWARGRAPEAVPVILAGAGSDAGRLYRRLGFAPAGTLVTAMRAGYRAACAPSARART